MAFYTLGLTFNLVILLTVIVLAVWIYGINVQAVKYNPNFKSFLIKSNQPTNPTMMTKKADSIKT